MVPTFHKLSKAQSAEISINVAGEIQNTYCWTSWSSLNLSPPSDYFSGPKWWKSVTVWRIWQQFSTPHSNFSTVLSTKYSGPLSVWHLSAAHLVTFHLRHTTKLLTALHRTNLEAQFCCYFINSYWSVSQNAVFKFFNTLCCTCTSECTVTIVIDWHLHHLNIVITFRVRNTQRALLELSGTKFYVGCTVSKTFRFVSLFAEIDQN